MSTICFLHLALIRLYGEHQSRSQNDSGDLRGVAGGDGELGCLCGKASTSHLCDGSAHSSGCVLWLPFELLLEMVIQNPRSVEFDCAYEHTEYLVFRSFQFSQVYKIKVFLDQGSSLSTPALAPLYQDQSHSCSLLCWKQSTSHTLMPPANLTAKPTSHTHTHTHTCTHTHTQCNSDEATRMTTLEYMKVVVFTCLN